MPGDVLDRQTSHHLHFTHSFDALRDIPFLDEHSVQVPPEERLQGAAPVGAGGHGVVGVEVGGEVGGLHHLDIDIDIHIEYIDI